MKGKLLSCVQLLVTPWTTAYQWIFQARVLEWGAIAFSDIYTHTHIYIAQEYYSVIKKNEIMPFAATWRDLEIIISK